MSDASGYRLFSGTATKDGIRDLLSGMASGFVCRIFEYPADTIKVSCTVSCMKFRVVYKLVLPSGDRPN